MLSTPSKTSACRLLTFPLPLWVQHQAARAASHFSLYSANVSSFFQQSIHEVIEEGLCPFFSVPTTPGEFMMLSVFGIEHSHMLNRVFFFLPSLSFGKVFPKRSASAKRSGEFHQRGGVPGHCERNHRRDSERYQVRHATEGRCFRVF